MRASSLEKFGGADDARIYGQAMKIVFKVFYLAAENVAALVLAAHVLNPNLTSLVAIPALFVAFWIFRDLRKGN